MNRSPFVNALLTSIRHPAFLFSAGNSALASGQAEPLGIILNFGLTTSIFVARYIETTNRKILGVPFSILAGVNFFSVLSIEFNKALGAGSNILVEGLKSLDFSLVAQAITMFDIANLFSTNTAVLAGHISAMAFLVWGIGHLFAGMHERRNTQARSPLENHQTYYGFADMVAVNASGTVNLLSLPFMILGFVKSLFIGKTVGTQGSFVAALNRELTAARLYGLGYLVGAMTSLSVLNFALAQLLWGLAYFQFKKES